MHTTQLPSSTARWSFRRAVVAAGLLLMTSTASAVSIVTYEYTAALTPLTLNGGGPPPATSTATGSFSYDSDQTPDSNGFFALTAFIFNPAADTLARLFDCDPVTDCTPHIGPNLFNPLDKTLQVGLDNGLSYYVGYGPVAGNFYSDGESYGEWRITSLTNGVPEPATLALFGLGLAGLGALRRRRTFG